MAIKHGQVLYLGNNQFVIDRIQQGGVPNLNIPRDRVFELGNYVMLGNVRDIPDVGFSIDSYSLTPELPALLTNQDPTKVKKFNQAVLVNSGNSPTINYIDLADLKPFDLVSPYKASSTLGAGNTTSSSIRGVAVPFLFLESLSIRLGVSALASMTYNLRGDAVFHCPGTPYVYTTAAISTTTTWNFTLPSAAGGGTTSAIPYQEEGVDTYALSVTELRADGTCRRLIRGVDYMDTAAGITLQNSAGQTLTPTVAQTSGFCMTTSLLRIVFASATASTYTETGGAANDGPIAVASGTNVHTSTADGSNPAALRGRFIEVYVGQTSQATPKPAKFTRVQSATVNWRVNLERDEEFNNTRIVYMDYNDIPEVTGTLTVKAQSPQELFDKIAQACNTPTATPHITGPFYNGSVPLEFKMKDPVDGTTILDIYIPNASFDVPGYNQQVAQKQITNFNWYSEDGVMQIYWGDRPGSY